MTRARGNYLRTIEKRADGRSDYPFSLPMVAALDRLELTQPVTILVGENGSGKSTLLEAIAIAWGFNAEGGGKSYNFTTEASHSALYQSLRLVRSPYRAKDGYFLRAESFYNVASEIDELDRHFSFGPPIRHYYGGKSLHTLSHGESFMALAVNRLHGEGLYILDEPEAALSPTRQLALLARMHELVRQQSQFLIATHSPIIMGYPGAEILQVTDNGLRPIDYDETEHVKITRQFLTRRETMLRALIQD